MAGGNRYTGSEGEVDMCKALEDIYEDGKAEGLKVLKEIIEKMKNKNFIDMTAEGITTEVSDGIYRMPEE